MVGGEYREGIVRMNRRQRHRGPDDEGYWHDDSVRTALGMTRLSIVDVAGGHQPITDPTGRFTIVFNGEIVNAPSLRKQLAAAGAEFTTESSDTEVLLHLFIRNGEKALDLIDGMFAFAIFDRDRKEIFLARDPVGIKPLYLMEKSGQFAFASELKSLQLLSMFSKTLDLQSVHHYLTFQFVPAPASIFQDVRKLPAGHCATYSIPMRELSVRQYWTPNVRDGERIFSETIRSSLRPLLESIAVEWTMSDVPIGCSLSGGIDSAALVGLLASRSSTKLRTWTLGFEENGENVDLDERRLASLVALRWGTDHREIVIRASDIPEDLDAMVWHLDEPYGGGLPSWYVFRAMGEEVKVAITGTGGDELFGNYGKWRVLRAWTVPWARQLGRRLITNGAREVLHYPHGSLYPGYFGEREKRLIWANGFSDFKSSGGVVEKLWVASGTTDIRQAVAFVDFQMQLPEEFLLMTDRFSMAWSIEARPPLLDRRLIEFVLRLPSATRSPSNALKQTFIDSVSDLLPAEVTAARKKGFVLPAAMWLRQQLRPLVEIYFSRGFLQKQGLFRDDLFERIVRPHLEEKTDNSARVWTLLMFQLWWNKNLGFN